MPLPHWEMLVRIATGAVLGAIIGYERDRHGRPAGLRTHLIVSLTAATFMVVSSQFAYFQHFAGGEGSLIEVDASRIAASVVSAVGFLAGGSILRTGATVQGLTTAAGLWLVTAIGLTSGAGMYWEAAFVTLLGIVALTFLRRFEDKDDRRIRRKLSVVVAGDGGVGEIYSALEQIDVRLVDADYERHFHGERKLALTADVLLPEALSPAKLVEALDGIPNVLSVHVRAT